MVLQLGPSALAGKGRCCPYETRSRMATVTYINEDITSQSSMKITAVPSGTVTNSSTVGSWNTRFKRGDRRRKPKVLDSTPYEFYKRVYTGPRGTGSVRVSGSVVRTLSGTAGGMAGYRVDPDGKTIDSNLIDIARVSALSKMNLRDIDVGTAFLESGKTADLVYDLASKLVNVMKHVKRRNGRGVLNELGLDHSGSRGSGFVDMYLAYQYGVRPAMQDIARAVQALTRTDPENWVIRKSGTAEKSRDYHRQAAYAECAVLTQSSYKQTCRVIARAQRREITLEQDRLWALGLDNPLATAYEVTPYSFVLDWAIPIGDWLSAVNSGKYYKDWELTTTSVITEETRYLPAVVTAGSGGSIRYEGNFRGAYETYYLNRTVSKAFPFTGIPVKNPLSLDHMASALSLYASHLARNGEPPRYLRY